MPRRLAAGVALTAAATAGLLAAVLAGAVPPHVVPSLLTCDHMWQRASEAGAAACRLWSSAREVELEWPRWPWAGSAEAAAAVAAAAGRSGAVSVTAKVSRLQQHCADAARAVEWRDQIGTSAEDATMDTLVPTGYAAASADRHLSRCVAFLGHRDFDQDRSVFLQTSSFHCTGGPGPRPRTEEMAVAAAFGSPSTSVAVYGDLSAVGDFTERGNASVVFAVDQSVFAAALLAPASFRDRAVVAGNWLDPSGVPEVRHYCAARRNNGGIGALVWTAMSAAGISEEVGEARTHLITDTDGRALGGNGAAVLCAGRDGCRPPPRSGAVLVGKSEWWVHIEAVGASPLLFVTAAPVQPTWLDVLSTLLLAAVAVASASLLRRKAAKRSAAEPPAEREAAPAPRPDCRSPCPAVEEQAVRSESVTPVDVELAALGQVERAEPRRGRRRSDGGSAPSTAAASPARPPRPPRGMSPHSATSMRSPRVTPPHVTSPVVAAPPPELRTEESVPREITAAIERLRRACEGISVAASQPRSPHRARPAARQRRRVQRPSSTPPVRLPRTQPSPPPPGLVRGRTSVPKQRPQLTPRALRHHADSYGTVGPAGLMHRCFRIPPPPPSDAPSASVITAASAASLRHRQPAALYSSSPWR
eukprot:TRINITY_DN11165_c0_g1_i1.p1 TRINITY_DN11165_c0_g1~~TRINITY_DN11165_c0_g1_i1.p1  ORF type:complete len:646 (+),score=209.40 TRINITY_DN11165_c0_g1_i1:72-2009(+)